MKTVLGFLALALVVGCCPRPDDPLTTAAADGDTDRVTALLEDGAPVDAPDGSGLTPLIWAARSGRVDTVRALLAAGADPDRGAGRNGWAPLVHAIHRGQDGAALALLAGGAEVGGEQGRRALLMAAGYGNAAMVRELLGRGVDPHRVPDILVDAVGGAMDIDYRWSGCAGHTEVTRLLLEAAGDLRLGDGLRARRAVERARKRGCDELVKLAPSGP